LAATYPAKCSGAIKRGAAGIGKPKISVSTGYSTALVIWWARLNERGGKWVLTWPGIIPVQQADTEEAGKGLAISAALAALPPDPVTAARLARANTKEVVE
jgi:hypothetical protein